MRQLFAVTPLARHIHVHCASPRTPVCGREMTVSLQTGQGAVSSSPLPLLVLFVLGGSASLRPWPHSWHVEICGPWCTGLSSISGCQGWRSPCVAGCLTSQSVESHAFLLSSLGLGGRGRWRAVLAFPLQFFSRAFKSAN